MFLNYLLFEIIEHYINETLKNRNIEMNSEVGILQQKTEVLLTKTLRNTGYPISNDDELKYICYMESQQATLQLRNEELLIAKEEAANIAAEKYAELYQFAPIGYFTLSKEGEILELNLFASQLLGIE